MKEKITLLSIIFIGIFNGHCQKTDSTLVRKTIYEGKILTYLEIDMASKVILLNGEFPKVEIETRKESFKNKRIHIQNGKISISRKKDIKGLYNVYVTIPSSGLMMNIDIVDEIKSQENLTLKTLSIKTNIISNIDLNINCTELNLISNITNNLIISGSIDTLNTDMNICSQFNTINLNCNFLNCEIELATNLQINVSEKLNLKVKDHCDNIELKGNPQIIFNQCLEKIIKI